MTWSSTFEIIGMVCTIIACFLLLALGPVTTLWALNALFFSAAPIAYTWPHWFAALWLGWLVTPKVLK